MTGNPAPLVAAQDAARTIAGHLAFLAEAQPASTHDAEIGNGWHGGFARDFATADGERVMVAALTRQQFADLAKTTRLARTLRVPRLDRHGAARIVRRVAGRPGSRALDA